MPTFMSAVQGAIPMPGGYFVQFPIGQDSPDLGLIQRQFALSNMATPMGVCNFFDRCTDEIMSLHYAGRLYLLDWMGFNVTDEHYKSVEFITYVRPEFNNGTPTTGYIADVCADPNGVSFGTCKLTVEDFGVYGRQGPVRKIVYPKLYCKTDPRRRLDGTPITDEREWDMRFTMDVLLQDVMRHLVTGNAATPGQFDGLEQWVNTGYDCSMLDSTVINWNGNSMEGGAGMTWNGNALGSSYNIIDVLLAIYRRIKQRIQWSPLLSTQQSRVGDMILLMPSFMVNCFLDYFTCWKVCAGSQYNEVMLQSFEARTFRNSLLGGLFGYGTITLDNTPIPILAYDHEMIKGPTTGDIYLLVASVGSERIWSGEFLSASSAASNLGGQGYFSTDGGRVLGKVETDNLCEKMKLWLHLRLFCKAPWMQARLQSVKCVTPDGPLSGDPLASSFYPLTSFNDAVCP